MRLLAMEAQGIDLASIDRAAAQNRGLGITNQLNQRKIQAYDDAQTRQNRMAPLMAGAAGGDQDATTQLMAIDPDQAAKIIEARGKMDQAARDKDDRTLEEMSRSIAYIEGLPELARPAAYASELERLKGAGVDTSEFPQSYSPDLLAKAKAQTTELSKLFGEADATKAPSGYRWTEGQDLEAIPGGPAIKEDAPQYEEPVFDPQLGKWYQTNPKTRKREYTSQQTGMEITTKDGTTIRTGVPSGAGEGSGLGRRAQGEVETRILDAGQTMAQITSIRKRYKAEFQTIGAKWDALKTAWKEKAGFNVSQEDKDFLRAITAFRADAGQMFALTLKELSGVAVNPTEFKRAEGWIPNPGTGVVDGDSPTQMESKIARFEEFTKRSLIKYHYITKNGFTIDDVDVDDMPKIMNKRGNEIATEYEKKGMRGDALNEAVRYRLADEFGLVAQ